MATPTVRAPVTPDVVRWARTQLGFSQEDVAKAAGVKTDAVVEWESGTAQPTLNQLRSMAKKLMQTPAFFFLEKPPAPEVPTEPDFRAGAHPGTDPNLAREMRRAVRRRQIYLDLADGSSYPFPTPPSAVNVSDWVRESGVIDTTTGKGLDEWIETLEGIGVLVFQMSGIPVDTCRGFSLFFDEAPIIVLNGADSQTARTFTLLHELAHLLQGAGALCSVFNGQGDTERVCNNFAAEVLMPEDAVRSLAKGLTGSAAVDTVAKRLQVSPPAAAIRLRELGLVQQEQVNIATERSDRAVEQKRRRYRESEGGPPLARTLLRNLGSPFVTAVISAVNSESISEVDAAHFIGARLKTVDKLEAELVGRSR